ncbi:MAG TPA: orotidine-5'-phosphate decarboxylase [Acidobacteriota bacterium]|nr:orotidine-5'-phosphate decarboxylase [Acidobacteriota bacterium]
MKDARSFLIVALDLPDRAAALEAVRALSGHVGCFKLGLEIFTREGPRLVEEVLGSGECVFLDLKLHDIPNTVAGAVRSACKLQVQMLTLHAAGGREMLEAARQAAAESAVPPLLLAVTALTSLSSKDCAAIGISGSVTAWVEQLASLAYEAGVPGLVASARELPALRSRFGGKMQYVIPGIRSAGAAMQDQSRSVQPGDAILAGADYLVVGRPILRAQDPARAADSIVNEIEKALRSPALSHNS